MITTPFCIYDCDVPIDGAAAVVISRADAIPASSRPTVRFEAVGTALHDHFSWFQRSDFPNMAMSDAAKMLWSRTDLTPANLTSAHLYDGFRWRSAEHTSDLQSLTRNSYAVLCLKTK